jgi:hypothetical protein
MNNLEALYKIIKIAAEINDSTDNSQVVNDVVVPLYKIAKKINTSQISADGSPVATISDLDGIVPPTKTNDIINRTISMPQGKNSIPISNLHLIADSTVGVEQIQEVLNSLPERLNEIFMGSGFSFEFIDKNIKVEK